MGMIVPGDGFFALVESCDPEIASARWALRPWTENLPSGLLVGVIPRRGWCGKIQMSDRQTR